MILGQTGINWNWYYEVEEDGDALRILREWRMHRFDDTNHPSVDGWIDGWCNVDGRDGVNIRMFRETGQIVHYPRDHVRVFGRRIRVIH